MSKKEITMNKTFVVVYTDKNFREIVSPELSVGDVIKLTYSFFGMTTLYETIVGRITNESDENGLVIDYSMPLASAILNTGGAKYSIRDIQKVVATDE